jgi:hypothetical protein
MKASVLVLSVILLSAAAQAEVDLEWQVENQGAPVGGTVRIDFYAVADNGGANEPFVAMDVVVTWNPEFLRLLGVDDSDSPYDWLLSGFPSDEHLDGLNNTFEDGDAFYTAWANFDELPEATPEGLLVTTFQFEALADTEGTNVVIIEAYGEYSVTAVYDDEIPGLNIVGDLGSATVQIGSAECVGDLDGDGDTDQGDLGVLLADWGCTGGDCVGDLDGNGATGQGDLGILLADWGCGF